MYKRQIYDAGGKLRFTTDTAPKSSRLPVNWGLLNKASGEQGITYYRTAPVSYTHLDVYKRQLMRLAPPVGLEPTTLRLTAACSTG